MHIDMRSFRDAGRSELRDHNGRHPEIIARMVAHHKFSRWLANLHREFVTVLSEWGSRHAYTATMFMIVFCRSGRHRAVAASEILKHVAAHVELLQCLPTVHCSLDPLYCLCTSCMSNRPNCQSVRKSMLRSVDLWSRLEIRRQVDLDAAPCPPITEQDGRLIGDN